MRQRGFTLPELMITVLILGILLGLGVPTFLNATLSSRLGSVANNLVVSAYLARSEAIKRNVTVRLCPSTNGTSCAAQSAFEGGWIVLADYPGTTPDVVIQRQPAVSGGLRIIHKRDTTSGTAETASVDMPPSGIRSAVSYSDVFLICRQSAAAGEQQRALFIGPTGRPSVCDPRKEPGRCAPTSTCS
ncbi:MAG: GspH/FimT family pseudopilin [Gammaproteobacteria bacterium]